MMKKHMKAIIALLMIITLCTAFITTVKATSLVDEKEEPDVTSVNEQPTITSGNEDIVETPVAQTTTENDIVKNDLYIFEDEVTMDKIVDGNVFIMGNKIKITGKINGNLFVMGNEITFEKPATTGAADDYCYVAGSAYILGNTIKFDGVAQDIYAAGSTFDMSYNSYILRDVKVMAESVTLKGYITRNVDMAANKIDLGTASESENEDDSVMIGGNLNYTAPKATTIPENRVIGDVNFTEDKSDSKLEVKISVGDIIWKYAKDLISTIAYKLIFFLLISWLAPKFFEKAGNILKEKALPAIGFGAIAFFLVPIISLILCFIFFGLAITFVVMYALLIALSFTITAGSLAYALKDKLTFTDKKWLLVIIISIALWIILQIPFIGGIAWLAVTLAGSGVFVKNLLDNSKTSKE